MGMLDRARDTFKGVFAGEDNRKDENPNTPEQEQLVQMVLQDYEVFKGKRQEIEDVWREEDRFYEGGKKHWEGLRSETTMKERPNSTDNIAYSQIESIVASLTAWNPEGRFEAMEPNDEQKAQELTSYFPYEMKCIRFKPKHIKTVRRMIIHGLLIYKTVYDPTVEGGRGQNRYIGQNDIIPLDYGSFFPDPRIGDFLYLQDARAIILNTVRDLEYFAERFGEQGKKVQESETSSDVEIFDEQKDSTPYKSKRSNLIEYWYKGKPKMMTEEDKKLFQELAQEKLAEGKDPSESLAKAEGRMNGIHCLYVSQDGVYLEHKAYVYDHGQYPIVARGLFPVEGSLWPKGYMRDMISPQIMLNKFSELAVETAAKMGNAAIVYEIGAINDKQVSLWKRMRAKVGAMLPVSEIDKFKELQGVAINPTHLSMMEYYKDMLQKIPRRFDSANGQASTDVKSGRQAIALQQASAGHLSTPTELIQDALEEVFEQYIELMAQFYTTERIGRVTGKQVTMSRDRLINQLPTEYETGNMIQDPQTGQEIPEVLPVMEEYVPKFDISVSVGVEKPTDREYWIQTAHTLFQTIDPMTQTPLIDAQAVIYAVEHGRLEPFSVIQERVQRDLQLQQQMQTLAQENQQLSQMLAQSEQQNMSAQVQAEKMARDDEQRQFDRQMQQRRLDIDEMKVMGQGMMGQ